MKEDNISKAVETICSMGCTSVSSIIETLEKGEATEVTSHLSTEELITLLKELKSIMAVYNKQR